MRTFGIRYGYYNPKDWKMARYCDPIIDTWGDIQGSLGGFAFASDEDKPAKLEAFLDVCRKV